MATIVQQTNGEKTIYTADEYTQVQAKFNDIYNTQLPSKANQTDMNSVNAQLADIVTLAPTGTDDTSNIQSLLDSGKVVRLQPKTYNVTKLFLNDNAIILTGGYNTIIQQIAGQPDGTRILTIQGSNVVVEEMTYKGNISTDTGEQMHAILVQNTTKQVTNVVIKGIMASNIRGDSLCISGNSSYNPQNIKCGNIYASNLYRNGFSITGGNNIEIGDLIALNCGVFGFDLESDTSGGHINHVKIGNVITSNFSLSGAGSSYPYVENIEIGFIECRYSRLGSTPAYSTSLDSNNDGSTFRNARNIRIKGLDASGFNRFAIQSLSSTGDNYCDNIEIETLTMATCSQTDTTYNAYVNMAGFNFLKVKFVNSTTASGKVAFRGTSNTVTQQNLIVEKGKHNGSQFATYCGLYANNLNITSDTSGVSSLKALSRIMCSTISGTSIIGYSGNVIFEGNSLTYSGASKESGTANIYRNNMINGTFAA